MSIRTALLSALVAASLAACQTVPQGHVELAKDKLAPQAGRVGVVMSEPKVDLYLPGASCLLCYAAAALANTSLNTYSHTLKDDDLVQVKSEIVDMLRKKGVDAKVVDTPVEIRSLDSLKLGPNMATKDFGKYKANFDRLVVIDLQQVGFVRNYAAYFPTSEPKATVVATAYMVDLKTNALDWYDAITITKSAEGSWDEAPSFPGLTNAYYQTLELGKDALKKPFAN